MKILALDSSAKTVTAAVCEDRTLLALHREESTYSHSETLLPAVEKLLAELNITVDDIDLFAVSRGPGSFTGVRIGAATIKGLAFGKNKPCAAPSALDALCYNMREHDGVAVAVMDARREQVYCRVCRISVGRMTPLTEERAMSADELIAELLRDYDGEKIYFVGDGYRLACDAAAKAGLRFEETPENLRGQNAFSVALLALEAYNRGNTITDSALTPSYLRLPQAERERKERENEKGNR